jgi:hypothetical protein
MLPWLSYLSVGKKFANRPLVHLLHRLGTATQLTGFALLHLNLKNMPELPQAYHALRRMSNCGANRVQARIVRGF